MFLSHGRFACFALLIASAAAQVGARGGMISAPHMAAHAGPGPAGIRVAPDRSLVGFGRSDFHRFGPRGGFFLGTPLWWDDDYGPSNSPQVVFVQGGPTTAAPAPSMHWEDAAKPGEPLLIELQGDRYVRISGQGASEASGAPAAPPRTLAEMHGNATATAATPLAPTVFIFRDGHREESSDYSIVSGVIYARGDFWSQGAWSKQIPVASLDLAATLQANQSRGVRFVLPAGPNEVVTRP